MDIASNKPLPPQGPDLRGIVNNKSVSGEVEVLLTRDEDGDLERVILTLEKLDDLELLGKTPLAKEGGDIIIKVLTYPGSSSSLEFCLRGELVPNSEARDTMKPGSVVLGRLVAPPRILSTPEERIEINSQRQKESPETAHRDLESTAEGKIGTTEGEILQEEDVDGEGESGPGTRTSIRSLPAAGVGPGTRTSIRPPVGKDLDGNVGMADEGDVSPGCPSEHMEDLPRRSEEVTTEDMSGKEIPDGSAAALVETVMEDNASSASRSPLRLTRKVAGRRPQAVIQEDDADDSSVHMDCESSDSASGSSPSSPLPRRFTRSMGNIGGDAGESASREDRETDRERGEELVETESEVEGVPAGVVDACLEALTSSALGHQALEWIGEVELGRKKSKRINGKISGDMKKKLKRLREAVSLLTLRADARGDLSYLRRRNDELEVTVADLQGKFDKLQREVKEITPPSPPRKRRVVGEDAAASSGPSQCVTPLNPRAGPTVSVQAERGMQRQLRRSAERDMKRKRAFRDRNTDGSESAKESEGEVSSQRPGKPRIVSDVCLRPPSSRPRVPDGRAESLVPPPPLPGPSGETEWTVVRRDRGRKDVESGHRQQQQQRQQQPTGGGTGGGTRAALVPGAGAAVGGGRVVSSRPPRPPRPPKTAAVTITAKNAGVSYAEVMRRAREKIDLRNLGILDTTIRRGINGGLVIEIPGADAHSKADTLTAKLREALDEDTVAVAHPVKKGELRLTGLDDSVSTDEVACILAEVGDCRPEDVKVGPIRMTRTSMGSVWARLPIAAAVLASERGKITIGWTIVKVELLGARPLQCFRCWQYGHARFQCRQSVDRSQDCFNCGGQDHMMGFCNRKASCLVCRTNGMADGHRMGGFTCQSRIDYVTRLSQRQDTVGALP